MSLDELVGEEFGSLFEVVPESRQLRRVDRWARETLPTLSAARCSFTPLIMDGTHAESDFRPAEAQSEDWAPSLASNRNNSLLEDAGAAHQQLTANDIKALQAAGKSGEELVAALLSNSATYAAKTEYSQVRLCFQYQETL